jgi:hypothetical protein
VPRGRPNGMGRPPTASWKRLFRDGKDRSKPSDASTPQALVVVARPTPALIEIRESTQRCLDAGLAVHMVLQDRKQLHLGWQLSNMVGLP